MAINMPIDEEITLGIGKSARNRIDSMIRRGVMPNIAGHPTLDAATGMAKGVKSPVPAAPPKTGIMKSLGGGAALAAAPSLVMQGIQAFNKNIPDSAVAHPLEFIGTGLGEAYARHAPQFMGGLSDEDVARADRMGVSAYQGTRFDVTKPREAAAGGIIPDATAAELPVPPGGTPPAQAVTQPTVTQPAQATPATPIHNPATPEQQNALRAMGITSDRVINHGAGVDLATANQIERPGKYGGKDGMFTQLSGYGDQNSVYARASKPGGRINEFYGAGTGKESSPGSMRLNVISSQGVMAPGNERGDWGAVENYYAKQGQGFGGKTVEQIQGTDLKSQLAEVMAMPANTFGDLARKRAAFAALNKGIQIADLDARNNLAKSRNAMDMARFGLDVAGAQQTLADKRQAAKDKKGAEDAAVALAMEQKPGMSKAEIEAVRRGAVNPFKQKKDGYKVEYGDVSSAFGTPAVDDDGKPISDLFTGRQVVNRDVAKERAFFQWMKANGITDTNEGLALYLGQAAGNSFAMVADAEAAFKAGKIKAGDRIVVGGVPGTWQ